MFIEMKVGLFILLLNLMTTVSINNYLSYQRASYSNELLFGSNICADGSALQPQNNESTINFKKSWYPWLHQVFPKCWESLQSVLCMKANKTCQKTKHVCFNRPCKKHCAIAVQSCKMLIKFNKYAYINEIFSCKNSIGNQLCVGNVSTNSNNVRCDTPLIETSQAHNWVIQWVEQSSDTTLQFGCALPCNSSLRLYANEDVLLIIPALGSVGLFSSLFTIASFLIDWKCQKRYPAVILFILNICFVLCLFGWLLQFFGITSSMMCGSDGSRRVNEPEKSGGSVLCLLSFVLIYFSSISISCWFVILMYAWHLSFQTLGTNRNVVVTKVKYFHVIAWVVATLLTAIVILFMEVEANNITNICFVADKSKTIRNIFVLVPYIFCLVLGEIFVVLSIKELLAIRAECYLFFVYKAAANITRTIYRLIIYGSSMFIVVLVPVACYLHEDYTEKDWKQSHSRYIRCKVVRSIKPKSLLYPYKCNHPDNSRLVYLLLQFLSLFLACIATSSWTWTYATTRIWIKVWRRFRSVDLRQRAQISWYGRMKRKKIRPFIPPLNPEDPLDYPITRRHSLQYVTRKNSTKNNLSKIPNCANYEKRRSSDDGRTVMALFSARRHTNDSVKSMDVLQHMNKNKLIRSQSLNSLKSFGHLVSNPPIRRQSSNLTLIQIKDKIAERRKSSSLTLEQLRSMRDNVYTPLSYAHASNIVADCIPYTSPSFNGRNLAQHDRDNNTDQVDLLHKDMETGSIENVEI